MRSAHWAHSAQPKLQHWQKQLPEGNWKSYQQCRSCGAPSGHVAATSNLWELFPWLQCAALPHGTGLCPMAHTTLPCPTAHCPAPRHRALPQEQPQGQTGLSSPCLALG